MAILVQESLLRVGVEMSLQPLDQGSVLERIRTGAFEAALGQITNNPGSLSSIRLGKGAPLGYADDQVARLVDDMRETSDPEAWDGLYTRLAKALQADAPFTFLSPRVEVVFAHRRLRGLRSPWRVDPAWHMEELWIE